MGRQLVQARDDRGVTSLFRPPLPQRHSVVIASISNGVSLCGSRRHSMVVLGVSATHDGGQRDAGDRHTQPSPGSRPGWLAAQRCLHTSSLDQ